MAILAGGNRHYFLSEIMSTAAEIIAAQKYYSAMPGYFKATAQGGIGKAQWRLNTAERNAYLATLTPDEKAFFSDENKRNSDIIGDLIDRANETREREHLQAFTKTAATFVAAGFAAPLLFGPATGGLYAAGSATGGAAVVGGTGSVALTPSEDVAAAAMENQTWTDAASVAMENQPAVSVASSGGFLNVLGDIVGGAAKILPAVAAVIPKVGAAINVFGGGTEVQTPGTSQPVIVPSGSPGSPGLPGLPGSTDQPYNIFMPGSAGQPGTETAPPIFFQTAADGSTTPNYLFYIAIAIVGFILLKKR